MITIRHRVTGAIEFVETLGGIDPAVWEETAQPVPADLGAVAYVAGDGGLAVAQPRVLTARESLALLSATERGRLLSATVAQLQQLVVAALAVDRVVIGSIEHAQAVALMLGLGIFDGATPAEQQARAAAVQAGLQPD